MEFFSSATLVWAWLGFMLALSMLIWWGYERPAGLLGLAACFVAVVVVTLVVGMAVVMALVFIIAILMVLLLIALAVVYPLVYFILSILPF